MNLAAQAHTVWSEWFSASTVICSVLEQALHSDGSIEEAVSFTMFARPVSLLSNQLRVQYWTHKPTQTLAGQREATNRFKTKKLEYFEHFRTATFFLRSIFLFDIPCKFSSSLNLWTWIIKYYSYELQIQRFKSFYFTSWTSATENGKRTQNHCNKIDLNLET